MGTDNHFESDFAALNRTKSNDGFVPLRWQSRLFDRFLRNDIPKICDLPTGLGKTSVLHIWLLALRRQISEDRPRLPTRLVYVVDRRTVVDQATELALRARQNLASLGLPTDWLSVSTLRGQFADDREWTINPARPAIVIGTVDLIGSRLLFSGYRSSFKLRPLDAGLLGQDTLLVLDEAHLSAPFEKLIRALSDKGELQRGRGSPMRVMCMSATTADEDLDRFQLEPSDLEGTPETNPIIKRYEAKKRLSIKTPDQKDVQKEIVEAAASLAADNSRAVVFVRSPDEAEDIAKKIRNRKPFGDAVEILTGTLRGLERDNLLKKPVLKRFLDGDEKPEDRVTKGPAVLVSTSAGEVGFDLNADHMVCDAVPLDSMIQRLGRVNRRGHGDATVYLFAGKSDEKKRDSKLDSKKHTYDSAAAQTVKYLAELLAKNPDGSLDASPKAIDELKRKFAASAPPATGLTLQQLQDACTPKPATVELTDILLDAWSMTTIVDPMPGRPPVAPWLRGIEAPEAQTAIAWRAEVDLLGRCGVDLGAIERILEKHRIRPHETLTIRTDYLVEFLKEVVTAHASLSKIRVLLCSQEMTAPTIRDLLEDPSVLRADPTLVFPATFGGIADGMLDNKSVEGEFEPGSSEALAFLDVADMPGYERRIGDPHRLRLLLQRREDDWSVKPLPGASVPALIKDLCGDISAVIAKIEDTLGMNLRLRLPLKSDDEGDVVEYLLSLYPALSKKPGHAQPLDQHVDAVEASGCQIAHDLRLSDPFRSALRFAAKYHDEGKRSRSWQEAVGNRDLTKPLGKSGGKMNVKRLGGYRHEFGTLLRLTASTDGVPEKPADADSLDLALHLIAVHHGNGRPHFTRPDDVDFKDRNRCPQVAFDVIRRFARLQRKYGYYGYWRLAWFENLLRCADGIASAYNEEEET